MEKNRFAIEDVVMAPLCYLGAILITCFAPHNYLWGGFLGVTIGRGLDHLWNLLQQKRGAK